MKEGERGPFFPKLRARIKDNNSSLYGKFRRFLILFFSKFPDQNVASYVLYIFPCGTRSEPGLPVIIAVYEPCIRLAGGKFELTNQDSAGGKNSSVLM